MSADHGGRGDQSEMIECPGCGEPVVNTRWPRHFRSDDCGGDEQTAIDEWGGSE